METKENSRPNSEDSKSGGKSKTVPKQNANTGGKVKRVLPSKELRRCVTPPVRSTMIPKLKAEANKSNASVKRQDNVKYTWSCPLEKEMQIEEMDEKLRLLEAKEKSIAEYYEKIKEINGKVLELQKGCSLFDCSKIPRSSVSSATSLTRSFASDAVAFSQKEGVKELLSSFERSINQISDIWLKTSSELSNILANFKNSSSFNPDEIKKENSKIQLAIKQAKSLTLIKTKSVIAEAKKLLDPKTGVQNEVQGPAENGKDGTNALEGAKNEEGGDSKTVTFSDSTPSTTTTTTKTRDEWTLSTLLAKVSSGNVNSKKSKEAEIAKKNETITLLNSKIFEFQKACNEHLLENSQLQYQIAEMNEKNQWNQVFWKQISKLKDRIKMLQQNNRQLEAQKKELELKMANMNVEADKMNRLNHMLRQQISMWQERQANASKDEASQFDEEKGNEINDQPSLTNTFVLRDKESIIEELRNILVLMRGQETFAHQKISEFETKIEEFKKCQS